MTDINFILFVFLICTGSFLVFASSIIAYIFHSLDYLDKSGDKPFLIKTFSIGVLFLTTATFLKVTS